MKRALVIRHTPYEGVAGFRRPIEAAGYAVDRIDVLDPAFAETDFLAPDLLVMMGGPMGVYERAEHPWIAHQLDRLAGRLDAARPTIGVCLGAQMIAAALGAEVYAGPTKEVGFAPITLSTAGAASPLRHLDGVPILHWHGDTFTRPDGVDLLASTAAYPHQAFARGRWLLALQCHPEMGTDPRFGAWLEGSAAYITEAGTSAAKLVADYGMIGPGAETAGRKMVSEWLGQL